MTKADNAQVTWDPQKKGWVIRIRIGEEVIKRPSKSSSDTSEELLRSTAVQVALDEGYELDPAKVAISR
jgi:hypothetical protein